MKRLTKVTAEEWAEALQGVRTYAREGKQGPHSTMEHVDPETGEVRGRVVYSEPRVYEALLHGCAPKWKCPECGRTRLTVVITTVAVLNQSEDNFETEVTGDHEWGEESHMECLDCCFSGKAALFAEDE